MCSLYSINNTKFVGQSSFQVVLCAKGSDSQHYSSSSSSSCSSSAWSSSSSSSPSPSPACSYRRKKVKGGALLSSAMPQQQQQQQQQKQQQQQQQADLASSCSQVHYPPLGHIIPYHQQQQNRRRHSSNNNSRTAHWHQFHHEHLDTLDASLPYGTTESSHRHQPHSYPQKRSTWSSNRSFASSSSSSSSSSNSSNSNSSQRALASPASCRDAGNRMSLPILDHTNSTHSALQTHSKTVAHARPSPATPPASPYPQQPRLHPHHSHARTASDRSRTADPMVISFAAAAAAAVSSASSAGAAATPSSLPRSALASFFCSKEPSSVSSDPVAGGADEDFVRSQKAMEDADVASPLGSSVESSGHIAFDGDAMDLHRQASDPSDSDASMVEADMTEDHHASSTATGAMRSVQNTSDLDSTVAAVFADAIPLERKSRLRRKIERLQAKNQALKSSMQQAKSDLALERQQRREVDQIYLKIRTDLNQKLEAEEFKVMSLKAELEQMANEMKELKDRLTGTRSQSSLAPSLSTPSMMGKSPSSSGYRIGYDSNAFALSSGFSNIGGLMLYPQTRCNVDLIDGQDDAEEFLFSHSYSAKTARSPGSLSSINPTLAESKRTMSCSEDDEDEDDDMMNEDSSDHEDGRDDTSALSKLTQRSRRPTAPPTSRRASAASATSLPTLVEEEDDGGEGMEDSNIETSHSEDESEVDDAPRTMMEIIIERERSRTPEDDLEDQPADANESFESMAQQLLSQATHSRFTVAQAHLQLEEIALKYDAQPLQVVEVIAKEVLRWWEDERLCLGGPLTGGWGTELVTINKETGERVGPRVAVEKKVETFFGPLLLQFVASLPEQLLLLEKLAMYAAEDARWMRNHNAVLVALYKHDVLETEAVLKWWQDLEEPQGVFGHGGNNLRSLNAKFVAWLEDEDEDSESESEDDDDEESDSDEESDIWSEEEDDEDDDEEEDTEMDQDDVVESMLEMAFPTAATSGEATTENQERSPAASPPSSSPIESQRRISFCTNTMYYNPDGTAFEQDALFVNQDRESKKYVQCPPLQSPVDIDEDDVDAALNDVSTSC